MPSPDTPSRSAPASIPGPVPQQAERADPDDPARLAAVWRRMFAGLYDLLIVLALWFATGAAALAVTLGALDAAHPLFRLALVAVALGYFALSWQRGGQTIGARAWRVRVESNDGRGMPALTAWLRALVTCLGALPLGLGTLIAALDHDRRSLQDRVAGTRVVRVPR